MIEPLTFAKVIEWSEDDQCFIGHCPGIIGPCCHGDSREQVERELQQIIEEWLEIDGDLGELLDALEFVQRTKNRSGTSYLSPSPGLANPYMSPANFPDNDDFPSDQLLDWPPTGSGSMLGYSNQLNPINHRSNPQIIHNPPRLDETGIDPIGTQYLTNETLLGFNTWDVTMPKKDEALENQ